MVTNRRHTPLRAAVGTPSGSVIVPFHRNLAQLERCLAALESRPDSTEVIVIADGAREDCEPLARRYRARLVRISACVGPAAARNRGAATASGDVLIFVDTDVVVAPGALPQLLSQFAADPNIAAVFGTYDDDPACPDFFSQYKNLTHAFVHRDSSRVVASFWAGFGGVRRDAFAAVGGFDETFTRPCIEDIELGYRLTAAGHQIVVDRRLHCCHLKRWTFRSMITSDIRDRGVPWTKLIMRSKRFPSSLNIDRRGRSSVALCCGALLVAGFAAWQPWLLLASAAAIGTALYQHRRLYAFLAARRGRWFAVRAAAVHLLYHVYNGVSFVIGMVSHWWDVLRRRGYTQPAATCPDARRGTP